MNVWSVRTRLRNFYYPFLSFLFGQIKAKYFQRGEIVLFKWSTKRTLRSHTATSECFYGYSTAFSLLDERWVRTPFWRAVCVCACACVCVETVLRKGNKRTRKEVIIFSESCISHFILNRPQPRQKWLARSKIIFISLLEKKIREQFVCQVDQMLAAVTVLGTKKECLINNVNFSSSVWVHMVDATHVHSKHSLSCCRSIFYSKPSFSQSAI